MFDPADVAAWNAKAPRTAASSHADAVQAFTWLKTNFPDTSYALINHPSRNPGKYTVADYREFNDLAPNIAFAVEGMVGNQMEPDRGGYNSSYDPANLKSRTYGGVDYVVAQVGGIWDALLGDGRRFWNIANSDHHFKTAGGLFSSGYFPGEYARNYVWLEGPASSRCWMACARARRSRCSAISSTRWTSMWPQAAPSARWAVSSRPAPAIA